MPFFAQEQFPIPNKDLLSWTFDDLSYDMDEPIYIDGLNPSRLFTARQSKSIIRKLVAGFRAIGLQKGDCVCIHSFNDICYPLFFLGVVAAGGTFSGTNPAYTPYELAHTLKTAKVKYVLVQPQLLGPILEATKDSSIPEKNVLIFNPSGEDAPSGYTTWNDLLQYGEEDWVRFDDKKTAEETPAALLFSSGTTGLPKAAVLSHRNFVAQHTLVFETNPKPFKSTRIFPLPMFHAATVPVAHTTPLRAGEKGIVYPRFDMEQFFQGIEKFQVTDLGVVPPQVVVMINSPLNKKYSLKSIRQAWVGAAPLDKGPQARLQALLRPDTPLTQVWGMTETSCVCSRFPYPERDTTASVGRPLPCIDAKLVDDDGNDITAYDVRGEMCVRGPTIIKGYFENPEANSRDFDKDGYFHTGDICYCDGKTKLWYIVDRKKELIKVRAFQVAPPEIEGLLLVHPEIVDCAVIGVPGGGENSELPRAYIVRRPGSGDSLTEQQVKDHVTAKLAAYKHLAGGVKFVDAVPKNASGKILKRILRDEVKKEFGAKL